MVHEAEIMFFFCSHFVCVYILYISRSVIQFIFSQFRKICCVWIKCIYLWLDAVNVQNILFPRQRISFSMFHFAMIFPVRFLYSSMLLRILKIIIYICAYLVVCFYLQPIEFFFLCLSNKNAHTHTYGINRKQWDFRPEKISQISLYEVLMAGFVNIKYWKAFFFL